MNPNGSGISLGHPLGATGARITATLLAELERRATAASMCIGQGQRSPLCIGAAADRRSPQVRRAAVRLERSVAARYGSTSSRSTSALTSRAISMNARAAGERCRSRCHVDRDRPSRHLRARRITRMRSSPGATTARSGTRATPKPAATSPCSVPLSSDRKAYVTRSRGRGASSSTTSPLEQVFAPISDVVAEVVERRRRPARERAVGRDEQHVRVAHQLERLERAVRERRAAEREIELARLDRGRRARGRSRARRARARFPASPPGSAA